MHRFKGDAGLTTAKTYRSVPELSLESRETYRSVPELQAWFEANMSVCGGFGTTYQGKTYRSVPELVRPAQAKHVGLCQSWSDESWERCRFVPDFDLHNRSFTIKASDCSKQPTDHFEQL